MTTATYSELVRQCAALLKRGNEDAWALARGIYQATVGHGERPSDDKRTMDVFVTDLARESGIRISARTGLRYRQMWMRHGAEMPSTASLPVWADAYAAFYAEQDPTTGERRAGQSARDVLARGTPATKIELARELLADPDVAEDRGVQEAARPLAHRAYAESGRELRERLAATPPYRGKEQSEALDERLQRITAATDVLEEVNNLARALAQAEANLERLTAATSPPGEGNYTFIRSALREIGDRAVRILGTVETWLTHGRDDIDRDFRELMKEGSR